jgi:hypothetical protein
MSVLKPRSRLVYFRVSEDEFVQFSAMCQSMGARSLSALVRTAMQRMLTAPQDESQLAQKLKAVDEQASVLIEKLRCINELLEANGHGEAIKRESNGHGEALSLEQTNV